MAGLFGIATFRRFHFAGIHFAGGTFRREHVSPVMKKFNIEKGGI
jgi:hypothetical protein